MKKVYSTLFAAACLTIGFSSSAQDAQLQMTPGYTINKTTNYTPEQLTARFATEATARAEAPAYAGETAYCTDAMWHHNFILMRYDAFNRVVTKNTEGDKTVYNVERMFQYRNPDGVNFKIEVDENNKVVVPLQKVITIEQFWSDGSSMEVYAADAATMIKNSDKRLWNQAAIPGLEAAATYDPTSGLFRIPMMYCFETELGNGTESFTSLYPLCYVYYDSPNMITGINDDNYTAVRFESLQLGDYMEAGTVEYRDSFLPSFGFEQETFSVIAQKNTMFPVIRLVDVYGNNTQLNDDDFQTSNGERIPGVMLVYNIDDNTNYIGNTYANLNIQGFDFVDFQFNSYVNFMMSDSGATIDQIRALKNINNGGTILYNSNPLGKVKDGTLTVGEFCNLYWTMIDNESVGLIPSATNPNFIDNSLFEMKGEVLGVESIIADDADVNAPVEYYNIQGVRVDNPTNGLYIRRQGSNATKVIL